MEANLHLVNKIALILSFCFTVVILGQTETHSNIGIF